VALEFANPGGVNIVIRSFRRNLDDMQISACNYLREDNIDS
jgi:hypothetical protein